MVIINGKKFEGTNVSIINGNIIIDGESVGNTNQFEEKTLVIEGHVQNVNTTSGNIEVKGSVLGNINTISGDIKCGNVSGNTSTVSGNINKH